MGILDSLTNLSPEQTQGLLAFAANTLQGANTGRPMSFGGALGGGIQAYQQSMDAQRKKKIDEEQAAQIAKLTGLKIQDAESDLTNQQALRERAEGLRKFYMSQAPGAPQQSGGMPAANMGGEVFVNAASSYGLPTDNAGLNKIVDLVNQGMSPTQAAASLAGKNSPTVENSQIMQGATPSPKSQSAPAQKTTIYEQRLAQAQALRNAGYGPEADAAEAAALKFQPKYSTDFRTAMGPDGKLHNYVLSDNGEFKDTGLAVAPKLRELNLGGSTQIVDDNSIAPGSIFKRTLTPGEAGNIAISRERLNFDKSQAEDGTGPLNQDAILNAAKRYNFDGTLPPMGMGKSAAAGRSMILNKAAELAGDTGAAGGRDSQLSNKGDLASQSAAVKAFNSGKQGNTVRSFNVGISHLDTLDQLAGQLGNTSTPAFNKVANFYQQQTGNAAPTSFNAAKKIVGDEIVKAIVGAGGGVADREEAAKTIDAANSPAQLKSVIKTYQELMVGQLGGLEQQYRTSTKRNDFHTLLSDRAKEIYQSHGAGGAPTSAKIATLADIAETARASGRSTAEVTAALRAKGYKIGGQ